MGDEHRCEWRDRAEALQIELDQANVVIASLTEKLTAVEGTLEKLQRHVLGQLSEKMPSVAKAIQGPAHAEAARIAGLQKRRENAEKRRQLVTRKIEHKVGEDQKVCPKCGGRDFTKLGEGTPTEMYELVPSKVERQRHVQEKLRCRCGETIITAEGPARPYDKARFGPTFMAQQRTAIAAAPADLLVGNRRQLPLNRQPRSGSKACVGRDWFTLQPAGRHARKTCQEPEDDQQGQGDLHHAHQTPETERVVHRLPSLHLWPFLPYTTDTERHEHGPWGCWLITSPTLVGPDPSASHLPHMSRAASTRSSPPNVSDAQWQEE
jgi:hypothetical protein